MTVSRVQKVQYAPPIYPAPCVIHLAFNVLPAILLLLGGGLPTYLMEHMYSTTVPLDFHYKAQRKQDPLIFRSASNASLASISSIQTPMIAKHAP